MSDFDKEAEREKLREKYEQDKEERKATQRMSDLLLKGATMTNAHCGTCGDPLFQQNGTTFCPSCHGNPDAVEGTDLEAQPAEDGATADANADTGAERTDADRTGVDAAASTADATDETAGSTAAESDANAETSTAGRPDGQQGRDAGTAPSASADDPQPHSRPSPTRAERPESSRTDAAAADRGRSPASGDRPSESEPSRHAPVTSPSVDGDLEAARDALVRSLETFAKKAAATDDPRYATECLEAAHEAGEALSSLR
ncbi:Sjogren's syndrome/scleroderma autoantigen 1 family protein [Natrinema salaciae]|uniref:Sjogren's syndrome/scleroderma autoantigen 1 (Autoantigen p27) n=1 Tax=Natrinema salaciae TaxID=1186196 RepID=A0A1H9J0R3_9EURY|nr:Sjogren's syndrome/scleroderma autoantigen 1 family protein [Natrinema salaciae]SEQ80205.1 Sjogren's syndrome/scleroderma autoantigen 1 (Autoantigen p27) [Natrinema salaciae]